MTQPEGREERRQAKHVRRAAEEVAHKANRERQEVELAQRMALKERVQAETEVERDREAKQLAVERDALRKVSAERDRIKREQREAVAEATRAKEARQAAEVLIINSETVQ
jgi:hypothetical protein